MLKNERLADIMRRVLIILVIVGVVKRCDLHSMERCMLNAFCYFGGIPEEMLADNMKNVVFGDEVAKVIWNTQFEEVAVDLGFIPKVCQIRRLQKES